MKALISKFGDKIYRIAETPANFYENAELDNGMTQYTYSEPAKEVNVKINTGLINDDLKTNAEISKDWKDFLKENKVTEIKMLHPFLFEVGIDFILFDETNHSILDEGVIIRHPSKHECKNMFRILGVDENDEMHHRLIKEISSDFVLKYRESVPCGIMGNPRKKYTLVINNIIIHQRIYDENEYFESLKDRIEDYHKSSEGVAVTRETFKTRYTKPDDIVIFDAKAEGIEFNPITIENKFRTLRVSVKVQLNDYCIIYDYKTIEEIFTKNTIGNAETDEVKHEEVEIPPVIDESDGVDEAPPFNSSTL